MVLQSNKGMDVVEPRPPDLSRLHPSLWPQPRPPPTALRPSDSGHFATDTRALSGSVLVSISGSVPVSVEDSEAFDEIFPESSYTPDLSTKLRVEGRPSAWCMDPPLAIRTGPA
jgi:hypothetical protein